MPMRALSDMQKAHHKTAANSQVKRSEQNTIIMFGTHLHDITILLCAQQPVVYFACLSDVSDKQEIHKKPCDLAQKGLFLL